MQSEGQRGSVLVITLVVLLILGGASASMLAVCAWRARESTAYEESLKAYYAAESAVSLGLAEITAGLDPGGDGTGTLTGEICAMVYDVEGLKGPGRTWTLTSTAGAGNLYRRIEVTFRRVPSGVFRWLAFGTDGVTVLGNTLCDSYDSAAGTYASQVSGGHAGERGDLASNGSITVTGTASVWGGATPGPGEYVDIVGTACVHGSTVPAEEDVEVPGCSYAPPLPPGDELVTGRTLSGGTYRFDYINLTNDEVLRLGVSPGEVVEVYVDGQVRVTGAARIEVLAGASAVLHHGGMWGTGIFAGGGGVVNGSGTPSGFKVKSASGAGLVFAGTSDFHGAVFAPRARVVLAGAHEFYGAVSARAVEVMTAGAHFDEALAYPDTGGLTHYESVSWRLLK